MHFYLKKKILSKLIPKVVLHYLSPWEFHNLVLVLSAPTQFKVHREWLIFFFCCASYQVFFPFLVCQGMTRVCSLSPLLAWKGISKLLWQDAGIIAPVSCLPSSLPACLAVQLNERVVVVDLWALADSQRAEMDTGVFGFGWRQHYFYGPHLSGTSKKIDSSSAVLLPEA